MERTIPAALLLSAAALRRRVGARRAGAADLRWRVRASVLADPRVAGAGRPVDGVQGPPGRAVALAAALRAGDPPGRRGAGARGRRGDDGAVLGGAPGCASGGWSRWGWRWCWASRGCARRSAGCTGSRRWPRAAGPKPARVAPHVSSARRAGAGRSAGSASGPPPAAATTDGTPTDGDDRAARPTVRRSTTCDADAPPRPGPMIDLNVQAATGDPARPLRTLRRDPRAGPAGPGRPAPQVISTTASFRDDAARRGRAVPLRRHGPDHRCGPRRRGCRCGSSWSACRTGPWTTRSAPRQAPRVRGRAARWATSSRT